MAVEKVSGGTIKNTVGMADKVRNILQSVENLFNLAMVERVFEDASIPNSKLVSGGGGAAYTTYVALLSQSTTNAPTAIVLENTLGFVPTFSYVSTGTYTLNTPTNGLPDDLVLSFIQSNIPAGTNRVRHTGFEEITIYSYNNSNVLEDDWLIDTPIEIRVY